MVTSTDILASSDGAWMTKHLNECFDALFHVDDDGNYVANVCSICDIFINETKKLGVLSFRSLKKFWPSLVLDYSMFVPDDLKSCYYVDGSMHDSEIPWKRLMLSKRTRFVASGLICCSRCKMSVCSGKMPKLAIANGFCFGEAPECLTNLTEIELAFITPVKTYGYCFSYSGGFQKQLKGTLSYYKVKHESIARTVAHFSVIGVTDNIVVLLSGPMTAEQSAKVYRKSVIRPDKVIAAIKWLCVHNAEWRACNIDFVGVENSLQRLCRPTLIDNSYLIEGSNRTEGMENIEHKESFQVFFPDAAIDDCTGAQRDIEEFRDLVQQLKKMDLIWRFTLI